MRKLSWLTVVLAISVPVDLNYIVGTECALYEKKKFFSWKAPALSDLYNTIIELPN